MAAALYVRFEEHTGRSVEADEHGMNVPDQLKTFPSRWPRPQRLPSMEGEFKNNQSDGAWAGWHQNGEKAGVRNYAEGVLHGEFSQTWPNGQSMMEGNYKGGNQDGEWVQWHENGQQQSEILYEDGKILGASYWNSNGDPVASRPDGSPAGPLR